MQSILEEKKKQAAENEETRTGTSDAVHQRLLPYLPFLDEIDEERRQQFEEYFLSAPDWLLSAIQVQEYGKNTVFIREGEPANMIYMVGKGSVKAVDYRIYGIVFDFMQFEDVFAFGGMEVVQGTELYQTTLETITPCTIAKIPRSTFSQWMGRDIRALKLETKNIARYLMEQSKRGRAYLFLQGSNRFTLYLVDAYSKYQKNGKLELRRSRQELADSTGLSVKTIDRSLKKLADNGLITREGSRFVMSQEQYEELNIIVSELIDRN
ncbi:MAG: Crp/Fnr family transcriptional regulator [Hespellia sp.]|nr:Crp/Fnr family transcriptional regulator [Hespellia sp.]